jgi:hypothetical protein
MQERAPRALVSCYACQGFGPVPLTSRCVQVCMTCWPGDTREHFAAPRRACCANRLSLAHHRRRALDKPHACPLTPPHKNRWATARNVPASDGTARATIPAGSDRRVAPVILARASQQVADNRRRRKTAWGPVYLAQSRGSRRHGKAISTPHFFWRYSQAASGRRLLMAADSRVPSDWPAKNASI